MYAIIDCNNFYASCERLFRPDLRHKPIVVLSNNDGCVIARSNEAKDLGIKMGEPFFKIKDLVNQKKVTVFSSNYTLYGDLSQRVMSVIESFWPEMEIYSIDEAFLDLSCMPKNAQEAFCYELQQKILQYTGIPTSIGLGPTKTLAKLANHLCKKKLKIPVFNIENQFEWLAQVEVGDIWGVGRQWQKKLIEQGILTAQHLALASAFTIRDQFGVVLMRTVLELQGVSCHQLEQPQPKKSIISSRSFGRMQTQLTTLEQAISYHAARVSEKARGQALLAQRLSVFVRSNVFRTDLKQYINHTGYIFERPTHDVRIITKVAKNCLQHIYRQGICYKKVGVMLDGLIEDKQVQIDLFDDNPTEPAALMTVFDDINQRFGRGTLILAAQGFEHTWHMQSNMRSPCYTTRWTDLAKAV